MDNLTEELSTVKETYPMFCNYINNSLESLVTDLINIKNDERYMDNLRSCIDLLRTTYNQGNKLLILGNAADAQLIASRLTKCKRSYPAIALTANTSLLASAFDDIEYDEIFAKQIEGLGMYEDVLMVISETGESISALKAIQVAKKRQMKVIGLLGNYGGRLGRECDVVISFNTKDAVRSQDLSRVTYNLICQLADILV